MTTGPAPDYKGSEKLQDMVALITGGDSGIGRAVAVLFAPGGSIINTGSETGLFGQPVMLDYSATKGAIHWFTKALAPAQPEELAPAYVFLASPVCSSYINGVILPVMGGPQG